MVAGAKSRWARRRRIELEELVHEPWVLPPPGSSLGTIVATAFRARGLPPPEPTVVTESAFILKNSLVETGRFLTVSSEYSLRFSGMDSTLKVLPVELPGARRTVRIISLKNRSLSPLAELFIDRMRAVTSGLPRPSGVRPRHPLT